MMPLFNHNQVTWSNGVPHHLRPQNGKRKLWQEDPSEFAMEIDRPVYTTENTKPSKRQRLCFDTAANNNIHVPHVPQIQTVQQNFQQVHNFHGGSFDIAYRGLDFSTSVFQKRPEQSYSSPNWIQNEKVMKEASQDRYGWMEIDESPDACEGKVEHCSHQCLGGDRSPVSNRLRCSCKQFVSHDTPDIEYYYSEYY